MKQKNPNFPPRADLPPADNLQKGFTLMEILVATAVFALVVSGMMVLFNYTLKINRRTEALRQDTQAMRNLIEFIAKEVRDGQIYYGITSGGSTIAPVGPCNTPTGGQGSNTYGIKDNNFAVRTPEGDLECFYLAYGPGNTAGKAVGSYVGSGTYASSTSNPNPIMALVKISGGQTLPTENLTPQNVSLQRLEVFVRPTCDPYVPVPPGCSSYGNHDPKIQPFVTILGQFLVTLPTGEQTTIYYQTSVSTNQYDIPSS